MQRARTQPSTTPFDLWARRAALIALASALLAAGCKQDGAQPDSAQDGGAQASGAGSGGSPIAGTTTTTAGRGGAGGSAASSAGSNGPAPRDAGSAGRGAMLDAGAAGASAPADAAADAELPDDAGAKPDAAGSDAGRGTPTIVAVGYAGLRVSSYDLGRSWEHKRTLSNVAADDPDNLRGVTYGAGLFVAVGHKVFSSVDGDVWDPHAHPQSGQWLGDVKYGNGRFVATGGYGYSAWSLDGEQWEQGGAIKTEASRSLAFGNGLFVTQTDAGNWYQSPDGASWTLRSGGHAGPVAFCAGDFRNQDDCDAEPFHGAYVRDGGWNSGVIAWSDNGQSWHDVQIGYVGGINAFAFGYTP